MCVNIQEHLVRCFVRSVATCVNVQCSEPAAGSSAVSQHCGLGAVITSGWVTTHAVVTCTRGGTQGASRHMLLSRSHGVADRPACAGLTPTWLELVMLSSITQDDIVRHRFLSEFKPQRLPVKSGHTNVALEQQRDERVTNLS